MIQKLIQKHMEEGSKYEIFNGIFDIGRELTDNEFESLLEEVDKMSDRFVGVIDNKRREIKLPDNNFVVASNITEDVSETLVRMREERLGKLLDVKLKYTSILRLDPYHLVFRENINKDNIVDLVHASITGHNVIAFTDLNKDELIKLYSESESDKMAETVFDVINIFHI